MNSADMINIEELICEIEKHNAIWDSNTDEYSNKFEKQNAWQSVIINFVPDFEEKPTAEQNELVATIQKRWRSIRTCYAREILKRKKGSGRSARRQYIYFEKLKFLETVSKNTSSNIKEEHEREEDSPSTSNTKKFRKRNKDDYDVNIIKHKIVKNRDTSDTDEDKLFLLSLVSEMHKVTPELKLKLKSDILLAISHAQQNHQ